MSSVNFYGPPKKNYDDNFKKSSILWLRIVRLINKQKDDDLLTIITSWNPEDSLHGCYLQNMTSSFMR